jgi:ubiquinone/menaquinone biosynthesis C-methylase UbiE
MQRRDREGVEAAAIAAVVPLEGKRVLEVGCGTGRLTSLAAARAASVYAFDPSAEKVAAARAALTGEQRRRVRFAVHDAEALDLPRERFDIALCGWSLWCVPLEGVVHALRTIHAALAPGGIVVDTQPVSARPPVAAGTVMLGTLDMREWFETIRSVDQRFVETIAAGLYELRHEERFIVTDVFDSGSECVKTVSEWRGTRVPPALATRLASAGRP